jgi:hypothetical protein
MDPNRLRLWSVLAILATLALFGMTFLFWGLNQAFGSSGLGGDGTPSRMEHAGNWAVLIGLIAAVAAACAPLAATGVRRMRLILGCGAVELSCFLLVFLGAF